MYKFNKYFTYTLFRNPKKKKNVFIQDGGKTLSASLQVTFDTLYVNNPSHPLCFTDEICSTTWLSTNKGGGLYWDVYRIFVVLQINRVFDYEFDVLWRLNDLLLTPDCIRVLYF